jgi:hypothetical protein
MSKIAARHFRHGSEYTLFGRSGQQEGAGKNKKKMEILVNVHNDRRYDSELWIKKKRN